ncbi:hypothetical protein [Thauera aminoaromatica]|uniref:Uncharacterized protein n=1 Tax=Thauera aminoaromatica TaxID=164330 RepID=A0A5C7S4N4_THASP|nr:hypothetical protein [Thauera aminoaromatica]TXH78389.1 MAG: hypothetical protein E6Q80_22865 [Thauera aminoaromatica]
MNKLKAEEGYLAGYETFDDVPKQLSRFTEDLNNAKRMHRLPIARQVRSRPGPTRGFGLANPVVPLEGFTPASYLRE